MFQEGELLWCHGCGVEILGPPSIHAGGLFCCQECRLGIACGCGERMEEEDFPRSGSPVRSGHGFSTLVV